MHSCPYAHFSPQVRSRRYRSSLSGRLPFWASPSLSRLANASGRIEFIILLIMDWSFASGCSPPRLSATQFPSATDSQCSVRWGLPPHCWCALSGALSEASRTCFKPETVRLPRCRAQGQCPAMCISFSERRKNLLAELLRRDFLSSGHE